MKKLNQIIALSTGKKTRVERQMTDAHHALQNDALISGLTRTYQPLDDAGEKFPDEGQRVQTSVYETLNSMIPDLSDWMDLVATQESGNTMASANITVDDVIVLEDVPVTVLLYIERRLEDLRTFIKRVPVLDPAFDWTADEASGHYVTPEIITSKTKKSPKVVVKYEATEHHPAQTDMYMEDNVVGTWITKKFSGAIPATTRKKWLRHVNQLQEATKSAREEANSGDAPAEKIGGALLSFIFGELPQMT